MLELQTPTTSRRRRQAAILPTTTATPRDSAMRAAHDHWIHHLWPIYYHCKLYVLTGLVTLFVARPISGGRGASAGAGVGASQQPQPQQQHDRVKPPRSAGILRRWHRRWIELLHVSRDEESTWVDTGKFPEIQRVGQVRLAHAAGPSPLEDSYLRVRRTHMLPHFESLAGHAVPPTHLPLIAVGGSGGGFRAMLGYAAFLDGLRKAGLWDLITWTSGVSGSCWTLGSLYTHCELSTDALLEHYRRVTQERLHPMSLQAFDIVARSPRGNHHLFGPLLRKTRLLGHRLTGSIMDLYATLTTSYLLLPRNGGDGTAAEEMTWGDTVRSAQLDEGRQPLPILTAIRVASDEKVDARTRMLPMQWFEFTPYEVGTTDVARGARGAPSSSSSSPPSQGAFVPLWSFGRPFKGGSSLATCRSPEMPLSLILGHCTSAPAGPLTGYISALLATIPQHTIMSWILTRFNAFLMWKVWKRRWGNPIRSSKEWNPWYALTRWDEQNGATHNATTATDHAPDDVSPPSPPHQAPHSTPHPQHHAHHAPRTDTTRKIKLMDAGISNNLPAHVFHAPNRRADIFIAFDASSDVQTPHALQRVLEFGKERGLEFVFAPESKRSGMPLHEYLQANRTLDVVSSNRTTANDGASLDDVEAKAAATRQRFAHQYCTVLDGFNPHRRRRRHDNDTAPPDMTYIYCPLLPHASNPFFDPATASFSTSYNLIWDNHQAETLFKTVHASVMEEVADVVKEVIRRRASQGEGH